MNSILNFICNNPISAIIISTIIILSLLFIIGWKLPQNFIKKITIFYREQKLFTLFPKRYGLLFCWCYPVKPVKELPNLGDYICVNEYSNKGYYLHTWGSFEYKQVTWEQVVTIAKENNH